MPRPRSRIAPTSPGGRTDDAAYVSKLVSYELDRWLSDLLPLWVDIDDMWAKWTVQPVDPNTNPFLSKVQVPYGLYAVEQILPRILGENPKMSYAAVSHDDDDLVATLLGKVTTVQMQRMGFEYSAREFIRQALVANYSIAKVGWKRVVRDEQYAADERHPVDPNRPEAGSTTISVQRTRQTVECNEPFFEVVNVKDFAWPLTARSIDAAESVWQRRWVTLKYVRDLGAKGVYRNTDDVTAMDAGYWQSAYQNEFNAQGLSPTIPESAAPDDPGGMVELWERWRDDQLTVIANRRILVRDDPNPFWHQQKPFVDYTPTPRPFQLHGLGLMRIINDSNEHLNTMMRQLCDAVTYTLNPAWKSTEGIDWDNFVLQPGARLPVPDTEDVMPLVTPQVDFSAASMLAAELKQDMQRTTGVFDIMGGFSTGGTHTATGVSTVIQQATMRIQEMINVFSYRTMKRFGYLLMRMNAQWLDQGVLVDLSDDPKAQAAWATFSRSEMPDSGKVVIAPQMLQAMGTLEPVPQVGQDKSLSETQKRSDATQALQAVAPILASPQNPLNMGALANWALEQMGMPKEDRDKVLATPPVQQLKAATDAMPNGNGASGPSGPSGEPLPMGGVVGTPGAAGGSGPPGMGPGR